MKVRNLVERIRVGLAAKDSRHLDAEKAVLLLGKALREINSSLQTIVNDCKAAVDGVEDEQKRRQEALTAAAAQLSTRRQTVVDCKSALKRAAKEIDTQRESSKEAKSAQRNSEAEAKNVHERKRHLETAEREAFEPLREAPASGSDGNKRLSTLRRTGKAFGFHNELLNVAGVVFKKRLESRRTFDNDVLRHIAREFEKNSSTLDVASRESEQAVDARKSAVELATECVAAAKASRKQRAADLAAAEQAIEEGQEALSEARRHVRSFPAHMKHTAKELERAQLQLERFCGGPQATYVKAFGALSAPPKVAASDDDSVAEGADAGETDVDSQTQMRTDW